jgi:hypothetical protein
MSDQTDQVINEAATVLDSLTASNRVENYVNVKAWMVKINYLMTIIPSLWLLGSTFGINIGVTQDQVLKFLEACLILMPFISNIVLVITSRYLHILPWLNKLPSLVKK